MTEDRLADDRELIDEIEHGSGEYTDAELLDQAQLNAQALLLGTVALLREHPDILAAWRRGLADIFIRAWDAERAWSAAAILDALLTNYRSFGATVVEHDAGEDTVTAAIATLPDALLVEELQLDSADIVELLMIGAAITEHLGGALDWTIDPDSGEITLSVRSVSKSP